ncbi:hypothetical protein Rvan_2718 [Rhodomicrobium vannielii ATCC 17100]|uniref:Uncharacterized protein n=1 Tax=Rhodomicrobium vannielii (strain ATCC 17100 / DSM 162 / LMG 4299 / NCIMB 10020 / ATH 3.1.1) TaxID=648757 RepID=E3I803_RHOVT|nr:hypothetical protein Rvan_2718 [Rhodomicrobium vannielii ATCC 17100]
MVNGPPAQAQPPRAELIHMVWNRGAENFRLRHIFY